MVREFGIDQDIQITKIIFGAAAFIGRIAASAANAHDFYLRPQEFRTPGVSPVTIHATVGPSLPDRTDTVEADRVDRLVATGAGSPKLQIAGATATSFEKTIKCVGLGLVFAGQPGRLPAILIENVL